MKVVEALVRENELVFQFEDKTIICWQLMMDGDDDVWHVVAETYRNDSQLEKADEYVTASVEWMLEHNLL